MHSSDLGTALTNHQVACLLACSRGADQLDELMCRCVKYGRCVWQAWYIHVLQPQVQVTHLMHVCVSCRSMAWSYNTRMECWVTQVGVAGLFRLTRQELVNGLVVSEPALLL